MRKIVLAVAVLALVAANASAAGFLVPRDGSPPIEVKSHRVQAVLEDGLARTTLRQVFVNPHGRQLEAIYLFPLPEGAALTHVAMEVGGKRLEGLLAERKRARKIYNDIVRSRRDPALVEQVGKNAFRLSVFPVEPDQETVIEISWVQHVPLEHGKYRYTYPLAHPGAAAKTRQDLTLTLDVRSSAPFARVYSSDGDVQIATKSANYSLASVERTGAKLDQDITIVAEVAVAQPTLTVTARGDGSGKGWFLALVTPPPVREDKDILPRDVTLVIDTSGSMKGEKIEQARSAAVWLIDHLRPADRVNLVRFSSDVQSFADAPVPVTDEVREKLRAFVKGFEAAGSTDLGSAISVGSKGDAAEGRVSMVVLLTDGLPTLGEKDPAKLVAIAKTAGAAGKRIFPFGVGADVDAGLLGGVASAGRGRAEIFRPTAELEDRLTAFLLRTSTPMLADVRLEVDGVRVHDVFPRPLPDAYLGEQVAIAGRYTGSGKAVFKASALMSGERKSLSTVVDLPADASGPDTVPQLFSRMKTDFLEKALRLRTGLSDEAYYAALDKGAYSTADEIVAEIISVSLEHGVQCAYTSFIVLLPEDRARLDPADAEAMAEAIGRVREEMAKAREAALAPDPDPSPDKRLEDPVVKDAKVSDHNETDNDLPFEDSAGDGDYLSDAPFEGPSTNGAIGIGGGAGGAFGGRGGHRNLKASGGGSRTEGAVDLGLEWLKNAQQLDGSWEGGVRNTGLALLTFLGAGETHKHGRYKRTVREGLRFLKSVQDGDGRFSPEADAHAVAALAMAEAYALTASPLFKESAQRAIDSIVAKGPARDPSVIWACAALKSGRAAGLDFPGWDIPAAVAMIDPAAGTEGPMTPGAIEAGSFLVRILFGEDPRTSEAVKEFAARTAKDAPVYEDGRIDAGRWYFASLALFQVGGESWKAWNKSMKTAVGDHQRTDGAEKGSWNPVGPGADKLGRVGMTALMALTMEVYYRYGKVFGTH